MRDLWVFFVHLRWHYQVFVLSGGFLLGGLFQPLTTPWAFVGQFLVVHLLLNGGLTAFNSYYDDDDGPIGGLEHPPRMKPWMLPASLAVQVLGLGFAALEGMAFVALYGVTMILSVLYSARPFRWKSHPILSLVAVGIGTGTNTFLMGYLAAGTRGLDGLMAVSAVGVALLLLSMYPVSQVFQIQEDRERGDRGFAVRYGVIGVQRFFFATYPAGLAISAATLAWQRPLYGIGLGVAGFIGGLSSAQTIARLTGDRDEYRIVMRLKYAASLAFVAFLSAALFVSFGGVSMSSFASIP